MRIVVHPASLHMGGSQRNAIDLAVRLSGRGHDVRVFGPPGPLADLVRAGGVPFHAAPAVRRLRPSPTSIAALRTVVREHRVEVVHAWEWPPIADAVYGPGVRGEAAVVGSVMSMGVAPFIPLRLPLTVGTAAIAAHERARRPGVVLLEPPVDTDADRPADALTRARHRLALGVGPGELVVVVVSRLVAELKREGILDAVRASGVLAREGVPVRFVIAGDGAARGEIAAAAAAVNAAAGREVVTLVGAVEDPTPHYAAADVVLGMGGSALRAMAFGAPLLVQGERGFWRPLTPETLDSFLHGGWYGVGDGADGALVLAPLLRELLADADRRAELGAFGRDLAVRRFGLDAAAATVETMYAAAIEASRAGGRGAARADARDRVVSLAGLAAYDLRRRVARRLGRAPADDFNAVAAQPPAAPTAPSYPPLPELPAFLGAATTVAPSTVALDTVAPRTVAPDTPAASAAAASRKVSR